MPLKDKRLKTAQALLDSVVNVGVEQDSALQLDSVTEMGEKLHSVDNDTDVSVIRKAMLDGANAYKQAHGCLPNADAVAIALDHAKIILDDATSESSSQNHYSRALVPQKVTLAIRAMLTGATPFAHYLQADPLTGEAPFIIVSHNTGSKTGQYDVGQSLNGVNGGDNYIMSDRTHKLTSSDQTAFTGKITTVMTGPFECKQDATAHPLYPNRTQILVNGLVCATSQGAGEQESAVGSAKIGNKEYAFTATVTLKTGETTVTFKEAVPENTAVFVKAFLNLEEAGLTTPSIRIDALKRTIFAQSYRSQVVVTPEAKVQFEKEIGIDPAFEGTLAIRNQHAQEIMYKALRNLTIIGQFANPNIFDFSWQTQGVEKTQAQIAIELIGQISKISQTMANQNNSHGVSHIYVGDTMRALFLSMGRDFFEPSGLAARPGVYRLGRLAGQYEVYYTPKGIIPAENSNLGSGKWADRMLLIGANSANPAFNPVIMGEASAPFIDPIPKSESSANTGYWVTGKNFCEQNPINMYAASVAVVDVINTAY
ncbi:hypothetical protein ACWIUH_01430 [Ursidibacter arcticus]